MKFKHFKEIDIKLDDKPVLSKEEIIILKSNGKKIYKSTIPYPKNK